MKIPNRIKIGATIWRVTRPWKINEEDDAGYCDPDKQTIKICRHLGPHSTRDTLFHELLHACAAIALPDIGEDREERFIRAVTPLMLAAIVDNQLDFRR